MVGRARGALAIVALLAGACGGGEPNGAELVRPAPSVTAAPLPRSATPTSADPSTTVGPGAVSPTPPQAAEVVLGPDGLGVVNFGEEADQVVAELSALLGRPSDDRPLGSCPSGEVERLVEFAELAVLVGRRQGTPRFVAWDLGPPSGALPALTTAEGVGVGTTLAALRAAYGDRLEVSGDDPFGPSFEVRVPAPGRLTGNLTGTTTSDTVATLGGGAATCAA